MTEAIFDAMATCMAGQGPEDCAQCVAYHPGRCTAVTRDGAVFRFCGMEPAEISGAHAAPERAMAEILIKAVSDDPR